MREVIILGGGKWQESFIKSVVVQGFKAIVLDHNPLIKKRLIGTEGIVVETVDITNPEVVLAISRKYRPEAIISPSNEAGVISAAVAAEALNLKSPGLQAANLSQDKLKLRRELKAAGLEVPLFDSLTFLADNLSILKESPVVVKPRGGAGSKEVQLISSEDEFKDYISTRKETLDDYLFESFVAGREFSIEGFVQNAQLKVLTICEKKRSEPPYLFDTQVFVPPEISREQMYSLKEVANRITKAMGIQDSVIHFEIIIDQGNKPVAVDCAVRSSGFNLFSELVSWCTALDTNSIQLEVALGVMVPEYQDNTNRAGFLHFITATKAGKLKGYQHKNLSLLHNNRIVVKKEEFYKSGEYVEVTSNGAGRLGYLLILGELDEIKAIQNNFAYDPIVLECPHG